MADGVRYVRVMSRWPQITADMKATAERVVAKAALDIEAQAKSRAPVQTGFLRASIQATQVGKAHWRVTVGADYGLYVEYGTVRSGPRPYFHPAIDAVWPTFRKAMERVVSQ